MKDDFGVRLGQHAVGVGFVAGFVVRLDERDDVAGAPAKGCGNRVLLPGPCEVDDGEVDALRGLRGAGCGVRVAITHSASRIPQAARIAVHRVGAFVDGHAGVVAEFPGELAVAGVEGEDVLSAALEQAIGEPADVAAEVGADEIRHVQGEGVERGGEFEPAAGDEWARFGHAGGITATPGRRPIAPQNIRRRSLAKNTVFFVGKGPNDDFVFSENKVIIGGGQIGGLDGRRRGCRGET